MQHVEDLQSPFVPSISLAHAPVRIRWDRVSQWLICAPIVLALGAYLYNTWLGRTLLYEDSFSHQVLSRRVIDSPTPGFGQSGSVWPALIHWFQLPLVWNEWLFRSGLSGALLSMVGYVIATVALFRIGRFLTGSPVAGALAAGMFALNVNVLYMQSTPMTELPLLCSTVVAVAAFMKWCESDDIRMLALSILAVNIACGTRYEGWVLWAFLLAATLYVGVRKRWSRAKIVDVTLYFAVFAGLFMVFWVGWNTAIYGDPLEFIRGPYSTSDIWVNPDDPVIGNIRRSIETYWFASVHINGLPLMITGLLGLLVFTVVHRLEARTCGIYVLTFPFLFYVFMIYTGSRPMHVPEFGDNPYNVRFALITTPLLVLMSAWLGWYVVMRFRQLALRRTLAVCGAVMGVAICLSASAITIQEPEIALSTPASHRRQETALWLKDHYPTVGGDVLLMTVGNEYVLFFSGVPLERVVYEGANRDDLWNQSLRQPGPEIKFVVMRCGKEELGPDQVCQSLGQNKSKALDDFEKVYTDGSYIIYERSENGPG